LNDPTAPRPGTMSLSREAYSHTPEGSEVDELEYANGVALWLFYLCSTHQVSAKRCMRSALWLDTIPGAGEYFRCMCMQEYSDELLNTWTQFGVQSRAHNGPVQMEPDGGKEVGGKWVKKGKNGTRRLKRWR
jgi:hypothetical protein